VTLDVMMVAFNDSFSLVFVGWAPKPQAEKKMDMKTTSGEYVPSIINCHIFFF
jgi:hypothetical protein